MAKVFKTLFIFLGISAAILSTAHAAVEFSARLILQPQSAKPSNGRIFVKGHKVRQEISSPYGIQIMIFRPDMKVTWMITSGGKVCLQMPYSPSDNKFQQWTSQNATKARFLGKETVCGMPCRKYQTVEDGQKTLYWISEQLSFPVKFDNQYETAECADLKQCKLDDSLFQIPAGCGKAVTKIAQPKE